MQEQLKEDKNCAAKPVAKPKAVKRKFTFEYVPRTPWVDSGGVDSSNCMSDNVKRSRKPLSRLD